MVFVSRVFGWYFSRVDVACFVSVLVLVILFPASHGVVLFFFLAFFWFWSPGVLLITLSSRGLFCLV